MTKSRLLAATSCAVLLALASCTSDSDSAAPTTSTTSGSSSSSTSSTTATSMTSEREASAEEQAAEEPAEAEPTVIECLQGVPGPALWTDGTTAFSQDCFDTLTAGRGEYRCPRTDHYVHDPAECGTSSPDPATIPYADGGTCPAALCGYGYDENGNPNPSSGEIQTQGGCEEGYITDPELCAAVGRPIDTQ